MRTNEPSRAADAIRALVDARLSALRAGDAQAVLATFTDDVVVFDLPPPLRTEGATARDAAALEAWLATWVTAPQVEVADLRIEANDRIAFAHGLLHLRGARTDGTMTDLWARTTLGLRCEADHWRIAHEHTSVPFHMDGSLRAAIDLQPGPESGSSHRDSRPAGQ